MVDGSDKMLDILSRNTGEATVQFAESHIPDYTAFMEMTQEGLNQAMLDKAGHAKIDYGMYYNTTAVVDGEKHKLTTWLCPVAEWVFGFYPKTIYVKVINYGK